MNPPANSKLQASAAAIKSATTQVPNLDALGDSDKIVHARAASADDVTRQLNEHAFSFSKTGVPGVRRYDGAQLASNALCEDKFVHGKFSNPFAARDGKQSDSWMAWGVFDGHVGWQMADLLTRHLVPYVRRGLQGIAGKGAEPGDEAIDAAIKSGFVELDDKLVKTAEATMASDASLPEKLSRLEPSYAGSCSLLTLYDPVTRKLRVACTGDSRAVLGRQTADGQWECVELSADQTGSNTDEVARLNAQFPGETNMIQGGRVWGIMVSRAFGDGMWKWPMALKQKLRDNYNATTVPSGAKEKGYTTGPYLTAEPVITTTEIAKSQPTFVIVASDGLWDKMSSQEAVNLVGQWVKWQADGASKPIKPDVRYDEPATVVQDSNAAVHLMRNGLGGAREELTRAMLTSRYPNSREIRDDITVQVVLFD
ncbi:phosphatase 2C-like domain-containing protein [Microdochium trichocladiopsis]|uniref:Phosphatase 2C-like domain-containing protein n=1 Tax=Microdochium trichocladiopsis TaxID=1682393 RepID=A0A9P9BU48_9PEZI|nr:phosphatase 2C-like domain-containing protein [Microdochium trichocladiopsis]KAH7037722.1 phosphatase 2C-like domain-containing protein [Microdochium trichocladiopsis]